MKLVVFIPTVNESDTIEELISRIPKKIDGIDMIDICVRDEAVDPKIPKIAEKAGATVYRNKERKYIAHAFKEMKEHALERGADIFVNIDADLQFKPEDIPRLVKPIIDGEADFVAADRFTDPKTGNRRRPKNMPIGKYYANILGAWIVGVLSGKNFRDVTCGFRAYNREALLSLNINSKHTYTQESFQVLALKKFTIKAIPVEVKYGKDIRPSTVVTSFTKFLFGSAINILRAFRDHAPLTFFGILGSVLMFLGSIGIIFVLIHWLRTSAFSPYISVGLIGVYLFTLGLILWFLGLVADMMDRIINNQEKILYYQKKQLFGKKSDTDN